MQKSIRNGPIRGRLSPANHSPIRNLLLCTSIKEVTLTSLPYRRNTCQRLQQEYELQLRCHTIDRKEDDSEAAHKAADLALSVAEAEEAVDMLSRLSEKNVWPTLFAKSSNRWLRPLFSRRQPRRHGIRRHQERPTINRWRPYVNVNESTTNNSSCLVNHGTSGPTGRN